jgi:two-component system sensor histidine kinase SenX3
VSDQGRGITLEDQHSIFERFYRGGNESTRQVKGVGLGLALVKHIVNAHGGEISVDSQPGRGSTFTVRLKEGKG